MEWYTTKHERFEANIITKQILCNPRVFKQYIRAFTIYGQVFISVHMFRYFTEM